MNTAFAEHRRGTLLVLGATAIVAYVVPRMYRIIRKASRFNRLQVQYDSSHFILAAGAIAFQFDSAGVPKRVLLVHHTERDAWLLAKGRKDEGEDLATTALREVFEETGYACHLHTVPHMPTCAPIPVLPGAEGEAMGVQPHSARIAHNSTEPFMITFRSLEGWLGKRVKLIFWYIGAVDVPFNPEEQSAPQMQPGSHQLAEGFDEVRLIDLPEAIEKLAFEGDRELVRTAYNILTPSVP